MRLWELEDFQQLRNLSNFQNPEEFYVDGQSMCSHRTITAGIENGNVTEAQTSKAGVTVINRSGPLYQHIVVFKCVYCFSKSVAVWDCSDRFWNSQVYNLRASKNPECINLHFWIFRCLLDGLSISKSCTHRGRISSQRRSSMPWVICWLQHSGSSLRFKNIETIWHSLNSLASQGFQPAPARQWWLQVPSQIQLALAPQSNGQSSRRWLLGSASVFRKCPHPSPHALFFDSWVFRIKHILKDELLVSQGWNHGLGGERWDEALW